MDQLITIETVPIKIEYVEKEDSRTTSSQSAKLNISSADNSLTIQSDPISIPADTFEFNSSTDWNNLTYTATAQYAGYGNLSMNVQVQNSDDKAYQYQQFGRGIDHIVDYFQSDKDDSPHLENMRIDFDMSSFFNNKVSSPEDMNTSFYPPDLELKVVERAKVIIKYVGGPIYVPPSADPDYDASKGMSPKYFPASADPDYDSQAPLIYQSKSRLDLKA